MQTHAERERLERDYLSAGASPVIAVGCCAIALAVVLSAVVFIAPTARDSSASGLRLGAVRAIVHSREVYLQRAASWRAMPVAVRSSASTR